MEKEKLPKNYKIKAVCLNCNNVDELTIPYGVDAEGKHGIYLHEDNRGYYNLDTDEFQSTAFYPRCSKCGTTSLKKTMHIENNISELEEEISEVWNKLKTIKEQLN